ncbi:hypothetical protein Tco_0515099, partial [Tanacetum coccineum]
VMSSASSAVTYTSVYTDSEPGRAFWGADDEEIPEGGIPRVIVLGYDGLPIQPAHDPDYVSEPIYPGYIPLEDEHEFLAKEQPLPPVDSPTAESPGYDGGDDRDDDDGDSSGDDTEEDKDDEDAEEEEEHLAPADSAIVAPVNEPVFPSEETEPVIPPPSTDITIGARITVWPQTSISLPPKAEVERLLAMTTPSPSPSISLSPPSAEERLARLSLMQLLPHYHHLHYHHYHHPPPVDRRDDIPESEQPPPKRRERVGFRNENRYTSMLADILSLSLVDTDRFLLNGAIKTRHKKDRLADRLDEAYVSNVQMDERQRRTKGTT